MNVLTIQTSDGDNVDKNTVIGHNFDDKQKLNVDFLIYQRYLKKISCIIKIPHVSFFVNFYYRVQAESNFCRVKSNFYCKYLH